MIVEILIGNELTRVQVTSSDRFLTNSENGMQYLQMQGKDDEFAGILFETPEELVGFRSKL
jgi:hypothetical protein